MPAHAPTIRELFTDQQVQEFLDLIRSGVGRQLAAQRIGCTGSMMRSFVRKERDPVFAEEFAAAVEEGAAFYEDRLRAEARSRALDNVQRSDRMLEVELGTRVEEYAHLRRDRYAVNGKIEHEHSLVLKLDPAVLDTWPTERLLAFRTMLDELEGAVVDAEFKELPVGDAVGLPGVNEQMEGVNEHAPTPALEQ